MKILDKAQIEQKIKRLAIEILEHHVDETTLFLAGINNNGTRFARLLADELHRITDLRIELITIRLNPADPLLAPVEINTPIERLHDQTIILVDDVANTGRTAFYACKPILEVVPKTLEVAVLVDRQHKTFPIQPKYVGMALATTLKEHIKLQIQEKGEWGLFMT